jgi:hypothetical protein
VRRRPVLNICLGSDTECTVLGCFMAGTLIDMSELFGLAKKSEINFFWPMRGIESGNSSSKKEMRSFGVSNDDAIDSGIKSVHVNDLSFCQTKGRNLHYLAVQ